MNISVQPIYDWYRSILRNPKYRWWIILGSLIYLLSPVDIAPDVLPIIGQIDDVAILSLLVAEVSQLFIERIKSTKKKYVEEDSDLDYTTSVVDVDSASVR